MLRRPAFRRGTYDVEALGKTNQRCVMRKNFWNLDPRPDRLCRHTGNSFVQRYWRTTNWHEISSGDVQILLSFIYEFFEQFSKLIEPLNWKKKSSINSKTLIERLYFNETFIRLIGRSCRSSLNPVSPENFEPRKSARLLTASSFSLTTIFFKFYKGRFKPDTS